MSTILFKAKRLRLEYLNRLGKTVFKSLAEAEKAAKKGVNNVN